ncbi:MAG: FtsX-like permease family protein [Anaerolineae bacterium]|nr:FtsX-like permease family protein [Anaerolineae bacterium]
MVLLDSIRMAFSALMGNKLRSALTMLGIVIGVGAVIALVSLGEGVRDLVSRRLQAIGSNLLFVAPGSLSELGGGGAASVLGSNRAVLTMGDVEALMDPAAAPHVAQVSPEISTIAEVASGGVSKRVTAAGVWPNYPEVRNLVVAYGSFILERDVSSRATVCVLGPKIARELFGDRLPLGERVRIRGVPYTVVGVLEAKGGSAFADVDSYVYVPLSTAQIRLLPLRGQGGQLGVSTIYVQASSEADLDRAADEIAAILRYRHRIGIGDDDDFTIINQGDVTAIFGEITGVLTAFLGAIAGISLLVGGIGIMNIMLVSVTERTREIGIRKAVGAKRRDILTQFMVEAVFLSLVGGVAGIALGWLVAVQAGSFIQGVRPLVTPETVLLAAGVSAAVGLFFGIYPARRAASLNPIEALRYE